MEHLPRLFPAGLAFIVHKKHLHVGLALVFDKINLLVGLALVFDKKPTPIIFPRLAFVFHLEDL